jgi:cellulose synthase/poly-beta-1,6-N-acetylglucosamine synthase-like glycosyltransferase
MRIALFVLCYLVLVIALINFFTIRTPRNKSMTSKSVTVLLPVRNEQNNVGACVAGLMAQKDVKQLQVIIINDQSTDNTAEVLSAAIGVDSRFTVIQSQGPREGWLGKVSALQVGFERSAGEIIICLDADVRLEPDAIARSVNQLEDLSLDFISPYPRQLAGSFTEKLIQPLLHWSWMSTVILRLAEKVPHRSTAVANGQFFLIRTSALHAIDGFTSVSHKILDDVELARSLITAGFKGVVTEGSGIAHTRMYTNFNEIRQGYGKSLHKAFGGALGAIVASLFIAATGIAPLILALDGYCIGLVAYLCIAFTRVLSAIRSRSNPLYAFLHPLSAALLIYLIAYSWAKRGSIQWKGRTV